MIFGRLILLSALNLPGQTNWQFNPCSYTANLWKEYIQLYLIWYVYGFVFWLNLKWTPKPCSKGHSVILQSSVKPCLGWQFGKINDFTENLKTTQWKTVQQDKVKGNKNPMHSGLGASFFEQVHQFDRYVNRCLRLVIYKLH